MAQARGFATSDEMIHMATTTVKVDGMTCGACTSAVEGAFKNVEGAGAVSVSLIMGRAVVHHDPSKLSAEKVAEMIDDAGFDTEVLSTDTPQPSSIPRLSVQTGSTPSQNITTTTLAIEGMTCGACTSAVEGGFKDVASVQSMSVSLLAERAVVQHDATIISAEQIAEIIEDRGFGATIIESKVQETAATSQGILGPNTTERNVTTTTVAIGGMTCGACTSAVEKAFQGVNGLVRFNISLLAERAVISHDSAELSTDRIVELVEDAGFDAKLVSSQFEGQQSTQTTSSVQLKVFGLRDASAATDLENLLRAMSGVLTAVISLATSRATITYDTSITGLRAIVVVVENAGYNALLAASDDNNAQLESLAKTKEIQEWKRAFLTSLSFAIPVLTISMLIPMFVPALDFGSIEIIPGLFLSDIVCGALTVPVQFGVGKRFYIASWKSIKHKSPTMDVLVVMGTSAAFFFSCFAVVIAVLLPPHNRPGTVFDTSSMLITFITLGRWLENRAKGQTSKALSRLMSLAPSMATIYEDPLYAEKLAEAWSAPTSPVLEKGSRPRSGTMTNAQAATEKSIATELIEVGDVVLLRPGDKVPADGVVTRGTSYVDESMVTGEAVPVLKRKDSALIAGTVNGAGRIDFRVTRAGKDTQLSQIVNLVQEAQTSRAPIQRMADLVAGYFVPIILMLGMVTFIGWMILSHVLPHPPKVFTNPQSGGKFMVCLKLCIAVIVFACPCALGLATPTAVMVGTGTASQHGILVKGGAALETATRITHVVLDKTGTLTFGKLKVAEVRMESLWKSNNSQEKLWWTLVGLAETGSEHPIGKSILTEVRDRLGLGVEDQIPGLVGTFDVTVGRGVYAEVDLSGLGGQSRYQVHVGNARFLEKQNIQIGGDAEGGKSIVSPSHDRSRARAGITFIHVAINNEYAGTLGLSDTLKPTAAAAITAFHKMGISTSLVTGDTYGTAEAIAQLVGIPKDSIRASVSPTEKQDIVSELQGQGEVVAMVGDGINDSPALATANIGIALVSGSDIAVEAADIVIMRPDDLLNVPAALSLCRTIFQRIKMNLVWACAYNLIGLPFAMGIFLPFGFMMPPMLAGAAMALSSVSVTLSSLALRWWSRPRWLNVERLEADRRKTAVPVQGAPRPLGRVESMKRSVLDLVDLSRWQNKAERERGAYVPLHTVDAV